MKESRSAKRSGTVQFIAVVTFLCCTVLSLLCSIYADRYLLKYSNIVDISDVLPWMLLFSFLFASYTDCFNFGGRSAYELFFSLLATLSLTTAFTLVLPYFGVAYKVSKKVLLMDFIIQIILAGTWLTVMRKLYFKLVPPLKTLLIAQNEEDFALADKINTGSKYQISLISTVDNPHLKLLLSKAEAVFLCEMPDEDKNRLISFCLKNGIAVLIRPNSLDIAMINSKTEQFGDLMLISTKSFEIPIGERIIKRITDIIFSLVALVPALPVMLVCSLLIILQDGHSPFFFQKRLTRGEREYTVFKFRTMIVGAEQNIGPVLAEKEDPRITKIGRFLRKTRLDELPQLLNVLLGTMSLVGPRPERAYFYEKYDQTLPEFRRRLAVKAGLTGFAQVWGRYSTNPREKLMMDLMYIQSYSIMLDFRLMIETIRVIFSKESAQGINANMPKKFTTEYQKISDDDKQLVMK